MYAARMSPRVFNIPASAPFLRVLIDALRAGKLVPGFPAHRDPLELARATLYLPTRRACRLARKVFFDIGADAVILPHIVALGELDEDELIFAQAATGELAETPLRLPAAAGAVRRGAAARPADHDLGQVAGTPRRRWHAARRQHAGGGDGARRRSGAVERRHDHAQCRLGKKRPTRGRRR